MSSDNLQERLGKDCSPRVQIEYAVDTDGAIEMKELPLVVGVMGDYSGQPADPLPNLKDRKFINIDKESFDKVLKGMRPRLAFQVENTLTKDGTNLPIELNFNAMADFEPANVAGQISPLRKLIEARQKLSDLRNKMFASERLEELLAEVIQSTDQLQALAQETGKQAIENKGG